MEDIDGNEILHQRDLSLVRKEVDRCLREGMRGTGFLLSIANSAHEGVETEALMEMCEYGRRVGVYR